MVDDIGHRETEKLIAQMDKKVAKVYQQAEEETQKKLDDYLKAFEKKDSEKRKLLDEKRKQLDDKKITKKEYNKAKKEYNDWRTGQIMIGKRWEEMRDTLAQDYHNANEIARSVVNGYMPEVYALNHNYGTFQVEKESRVDTSYTLYDRQTVERLMRDDPELLPAPGEQMKKTFERFDAYKDGKSVELSKKEKRAFDKLIADNKDIRWQKWQIQSVMTQSILQGESIPHMAQRVARTMGETNRKATTRYVRTAATGAQNAGRVDSYKRAEKMGIELEQEWLATLDNRTRHEHRELDGQHVPVGKPFEVDGEEIRFPGDPQAAGHLIWNCRCTLVPHLKNLNQSDAPRNSKLDNMTYDEWKNEHKGEHVEEKEMFKFTPASTIEEAEEYLRQYVDETRFGALGVSYRGISVDVANEVNRTIAQFYETFEVEKFGGVVAPAGNTKYGKQIQGATAAYTDVRRSFLLNRTSLKTIDTAEATFQAEQKAIQDLLEHPEKYDLSKASSRLIRVVENSKVSGRATIPRTVEETINHELGHSLERQVKKTEKYDEIIENMPQYAKNVSGYACENYGEYIGESFCSYMKGEGIIDPVLSSVFDSFRR